MIRQLSVKIKKEKFRNVNLKIIYRTLYSSDIHLLSLIRLLNSKLMGNQRLKIKNIFERFYRSKDEKIKTVSGFGIGLYLVAEILRYHGSQIKIESIRGHGATFYFILECAE